MQKPKPTIAEQILQKQITGYDRTIDVMSNQIESLRNRIHGLEIAKSQAKQEIWRIHNKTATTTKE